MIDDPDHRQDEDEDEEPPDALPLDQGEPPFAAATGDSAAPSTTATPVPVTLITGFLGAGKTTLVRHILTARHGARIAVVLNEYGGDGDGEIEAAFVRDEAGVASGVPEWVELSNGCLCCSVKAEFLQALEALVAPGSRHEGKFDAVLVETTGLADPGPIIAELWGDEELEPRASLDSVVTVVDASNAHRQLSEAREGGAANEAQLQVAMADVVLVNKTDLVLHHLPLKQQKQKQAQQQAAPTTLPAASPDASGSGGDGDGDGGSGGDGEARLAALEGRLRGINAAAALVRCERGAVDPSLLFGRGGYRLRDARGAPLLAEAAGGGGGGGGGGGDDGAGGAGAAAPLLRSDAAAARDGLEAFAGAAAAAAEVEERWSGGGGGGGGCGDPSHDHDHDHHGGHGGQPPRCASHDASIRTVALRCERPVDLRRLEAWLEGLLWQRGGGGAGGGGGTAQAQQTDDEDGNEQQQQQQQRPAASTQEPPPPPPAPLPIAATRTGMEVIRLKGIVDAAGSDRAHMVQAVYEAYDLVPGPPWPRLEERWASLASAADGGGDAAAGGAGAAAAGGGEGGRKGRRLGRATRLVVIGRRLDRSALQEGLEACAA